MTAPQIVLHGTPRSGHAHRVELLLLALGLPHQLQAAPVAVRRTDAFRALNALQEVPVLVDGDLILADSNAILVYLAKRYGEGTNWLPEEPVAAARVQRWLSSAAGEVMHGPATARLIVQFGIDDDIERAGRIAAKLLAFMDEHLATRVFLAADHPTIADLACYSYVAHAPEGGVPLAPYAHLRAWIARIEALPFFKAMPGAPLSKAE
ncbi:glutathione S-transferase [Bosea sp. PAMC 26642]|uniref:glutathione S-transferase n=1 Tax=Bosea sp. (strain PAMC 26642) TaxID=1792307 RepID=UPI000770574B|nr:glutathione S-transferase [Bosea sp. PAMC 26642]AMJ60839.1 glutathione S-transferase [Bosea sp. PAMC 26642]